MAAKCLTQASILALGGLRRHLLLTHSSSVIIKGVSDLGLTSGSYSLLEGVFLK